MKHQPAPFRTRQAIKAMVSEVDLDGDGEISFDEFASWRHFWEISIDGKDER